MSERVRQVLAAEVAAVEARIAEMTKERACVSEKLAELDQRLDGARTELAGLVEGIEALPEGLRPVPAEKGGRRVQS